MTGETEQAPSGLTVDTLKLLMDERDRRYEQRFAASEKAVDKALDATERRFESVNEFRATLIDQTNTFIPRTEVVGITDRLGERLKVLEATSNATSGQSAGVRLTMGAIGGLLAAVAAIVVVVNLVIALATR